MFGDLGWVKRVLDLGSNLLLNYMVCLTRQSLMLLIKRRKKALHRLLGLLQGGSKHHL